MAAGASAWSNATISSAIGSLQRGDDPFGQPRVGERRGADGDERGTGAEIIASVLGSRYAARADNRHAGERFRRPTDGQQSDWQQRRAADAAEPVAEPGLAAMICQAGHGVDERDAVGARIASRARDDRD